MKYCLIISQYYHSRHSFIVRLKKDFITQARGLVKELEEYKRENNDREYRYGDLENTDNEGKIRFRYNVNDEGDIYFINSKFANRLKDFAVEYGVQSYKEAHRGYIAKRILEKVSIHHNFDKVYEIVNKYFEIV